MSDIAISVENLSKQYRIGAKQERQDTLRDWLVSRFRRRSHNAQDELIWALKDVSFEVKKGEVLGIIGRNGAGKSTLLKILSRITEPTKGRAVINGRVGSLLEVGTGFHRELTGRENIFLSGTILGMKRSEIDQRFDEIVEFSGVEKFIDTPIKRYSSGMMVRLGFAVAAHLEPEILLVDEVLAVGDAEFQRKCIGKMGEVAKEGRTVLFVSHNMAAVLSMCPRSVLLGNGHIIREGSTDEVASEYLKSSVETGEVTIGRDEPRIGTGAGYYEQIRFLDTSGNQIDKIAMGDDLVVELNFHCKEQLDHLNFGVALRGPMQERVLQALSQVTYGSMPTASTGGSVRVTIRQINLVSGMYYLTVGIDPYVTWLRA